MMADGRTGTRALRPTILVFSAHLPTQTDPVAGVFVYDQAEALSSRANVFVCRMAASHAHAALTHIAREEKQPWDRGVTTYSVEYRPLASVFNYLVRALAVSRVIDELDRQGCRPALLHVH